MDGLDQSKVISIIVFGSIFLVFFIIIIRETVAWYTKRNEQIKNQKEIIRLLKKIAGEENEQD